MHFDLEQRRAWLSAGELSDFLAGPREGGAGAGGLWRAQLGVRWHRELRQRAEAGAPAARFEVEVRGELAHRGWTLVLGGRIDQLLEAPEGALVREIKTVSRALPADEAELRAEFPAYFVQLAAYAEVLAPAPAGAELVFVEVASGAVQPVALAPADRALLLAQLERVAEFLEQRLRSTQRLRAMRVRPPFAQPRPGQAEALAGLQAAVRERLSAGRAPRLLLEAPTGFGKTGVLLEFALEELRSGRFDRLVYLTGKSTGQWQVVSTLGAMTGEGGGPSVWQVRAKAEHCVNSVYHCVRERCAYLDGVAQRWGESGLSRFYLFEGEPRDLGSLKAAGQAALICPYEITRAALAFSDVWIGDYNYVFSPATRGLFFQQPGFDPGRALLVVDEAHNLPSRAADARSHAFNLAEAEEAGSALRSQRAPAALLLAWEQWSAFLAGLPAGGALGEADAEEGARLLDRLGEELSAQPLDRGLLRPAVSDSFSAAAAAASELAGQELPRLWWSPRAGELRITCLDAAPAVGAALREFGGAVLASATPGPLEDFARACGLFDKEAEAGEARLPERGELGAPGASRPTLGDLGKRETRTLLSRLTTGAGLLRAGEERVDLARIEADAPWRNGAYETACDLRVDTRFQERERHYGRTAATIAAVRRSSARPAAVFFSSYAYAERIGEALGDWDLKVALQPRRAELAAQAAWMEEALATADALFLVLGSSFSESIDALGGRVDRAVVVGPALPEVNAVQRARLAVLASEGRDAAFRRVYRVPGMQKVNQALGRLVRAPGQSTKVLLHCRRFAEPEFASLLAPEYRAWSAIREDDELDKWLQGNKMS